LEDPPAEFVEKGTANGTPYRLDGTRRPDGDRPHPEKGLFLLAGVLGHFLCPRPSDGRAVLISWNGATVGSVTENDESQRVEERLQVVQIVMLPGKFAELAGI
jgi:hypothetical protein